MFGKNFKRLFRPKQRSQDIGQNIGQSIVFDGDYGSWDDATRNSTGYDANVILEKTCAALLKVKSGEAVYERDSVLFDKIQHSFPVLAGLLRAAQAHDGRLCVVDFGGALGSSYFQCRGFLQAVQQFEWLVVEQSAHIACGRKNFESNQLRFYNTIEECKAGHQPNALLLSSVLQYLPNPYDVLQKLLSHRISHVIIDRTAFLVSDRERLTVQHVPDSIYPASYPAWFFSETKFTAAIESAGYSLAADFPSYVDDYSPEGEKGNYKGFIYEIRKLC
jgi:putative methyltransferase (TIGR04325 family)